MADAFVELPLGDQVTLHVLPTEKFKTTLWRVVLRRNLQAEEVTATACLPFVLRRGTRRHPATRELARYLEELYGAHFSADVSKIGETQNIELTLEMANDRFLSAEARLLEAAVGFLRDVLFEPATRNGAFREDYVGQEAGQLRRRIEGLINDKRQYAAHRLREEMCRDEPYGLLAYGKPEELARVDPARLYEHYARVLAESPVDIFVVGAVDPAEVRGLVARELTFPRGRVCATRPPVVQEVGEPRTVTEEQPVQQGILALGLRTPVRYPHDDYAALLMYNGVLGGYPHSKLFLNVREKASLAYFVHSRLEATKGILTVMAGIDVARSQQARDIIQRQVEDIVAGKVSDEELEATRKALVNGLLSSQDEGGHLIHARLTGLVNGRPRSLEEVAAAVRQVTREDVVRVAGGMRLDTVYFLRTPAGGARRAGQAAAR